MSGRTRRVTSLREPSGWKHASVGAARGGLVPVGTGVDVTEFR